MTKPPRYMVCIYGRSDAAANFGSIDVTHGFTARGKAERFARAISEYLPEGTHTGGCALAWVMVGACAVSAYVAANYSPVHYYLTYDRGGVVVKHHAINAGYHGYCSKPAPRVFARFGHLTE